MNNNLKWAYVYLTIVLLFFSCERTKTQTKDPWTQLDGIVESVKLPNFPDRTYNIIDFGAISDGKTDNTFAFEEAIATCTEEGGGKVVVPEGSFLTGPIHLEDNVNLHLEKGSEILFSKKLKDYYPLVRTSFEGTELMNFSPLIYAYQKKNIAVTGMGVLNGQASNTTWWPWKGSERYGWTQGEPNQQIGVDRKEAMVENKVPVTERTFGKEYYLRPSFIEPFECKNVLIKDVKIINAPCWVIHPMKSTNIIIDGVTVDTHGPNNDGCDPEYSKNVIIKNCTFNTGDDCIAIKSGRDDDGRRVGIASENIVVQNCKMIDGHGGVVMGSEISAGVKNVFVENCIMDSPDLERAIRIKSNSKRGGFVKNLYVRDVKVGQVSEAVLKINLFYGFYGVQEGDHIPEVKNIFLENVHVNDGGKYGILAKGYPELPISHITLKNVVIENVDSVYALENVEILNFIDTKFNGKLMESINMTDSN